jgi:hypothetical protein
MTFDRRGLVLSGIAGTVGAGTAALLLDLRHGDEPSVVLGFALGVAVAGLALAIGFLGWTALSGAGVDGGSLYPAAAGVLSASMLTVGVASNYSGGQPRTAQIVLAAAGVLMIVGFALLFISELTAAES